MPSGSLRDVVREISLNGLFATTLNILKYWKISQKEGDDAREAIRRARELFDVNYYLEHYKDVCSLGADPFEHFMNVGWHEGRNPSAEFTTVFYLERYPDVRASGINPFLHWINHRNAGGRADMSLPEIQGFSDSEISSIERAFDRKYYAEASPGLRDETVDPFLHYMLHGWREGRDPCADFSTALYLSRFPDIAAAGINPFVHWILVGRDEGRLGTPFEALDHSTTQDQMARIREAFDTAYYREQYEDLREAAVDLFKHYMSHGWREGRDPCADFSTNLYLNRYPDVAKAKLNPFAHWILAGRAEARLGLPFPDVRESTTQSQMELIQETFDPEYYRKRCEDLCGRRSDPFKHYMTQGWRQGHDPCAGFSTSFYLDRYPEVKEEGLNPFAYWVLEGRPAGRMGLPAAMMTLDAFEAESGRDFSYDGLPDDARGQFPYGFPAAKIKAPILIHARTGDEKISARVRQALAITDGDVHVVVPLSFPDRPLSDREGRVSERRYADGKLRATIVEVLSACPNGYVGFWGADAVPTLIAWPLLSGTIQVEKGASYVGAAIANPDGYLLRSDFGDGLQTIPEPYAAGRYSRNADLFRLRPGSTMEASLGVGNRDALLAAIRGGGDAEENTLQGIFNQLSVPERSDGSSGILVQGCAIAEIDMEPSYDPGRAGDRQNGEKADTCEAVLFVDSVPPAPDRDAGSVMAANFIDMFLERGAKVFFYCTDFREQTNPYTLALAAHGVTCFSMPEFRSYQDVCTVIAEKPLAPILVFLTRVHSGGRFFEATRQALPKARIVFNTVDLHGLREIREAKLSGSASELFRARSTYTRELSLIQQSDATILVSEAEIAELEPTRGYANLWLVPLITEFRPPATPFTERRDIMFVGGFNHYPNIDAVEYIAQDLWPAIRERDADLRLKVVGPDFPDRLRPTLPEGIEVLGFVPDLSEELERVRLTIAPLRYGAGTKGKIGTSLSHGVPCVTSPLGAEGMGLSDGENVLIADEPTAFANAVVRLYTDEKLWTRLSIAGYRFSEERYSRPVVASKINALLDELSK